MTKKTAVPATAGQLAIDLWALRNLLENPTAWTQGAWAQKADGFTCNPQDPRATCWCLSGAMRHLRISHKRRGALRTALGQMLPERFRDQDRAMSLISVFNDDPETRHADVLAVIDRTLAAAAN